jgi:hypothetical protein
MTKQVNVVQTEGAEVAADVLATALVAISEGVTKLRAGRLNDRALTVLLHDITGVPRRDIKVVLNGLETLKSAYVRQPKAESGTR